MKKREKKSGYNFDTKIHYTFPQVFFLQTLLYLWNSQTDWRNIFLEAN